MSHRIAQALQNPDRAVRSLWQRSFQPLTAERDMERFVRRFNQGFASAPFILYVAPQFDYGDCRRGYGFEENNFLDSLVHSGYRVTAFDQVSCTHAVGKSNMNKILLELVYREEPSLLFLVMFKDEIAFNTLDKIREVIGVPTLNWFCDDHWRFGSFSRMYAPHLSWSVTTDPAAVEKYREIGVSNVLLSQWACNTHLYHPLSVPQIQDAAFVGQPHGNRPEVIHAVRRSGVEVAAYGFGWPSGRVSLSEMVAVFCQTRINLNLSNASTGGEQQIKGRDFEIPGCGAFMLTARTAGVDTYFLPDQEIVCYDSLADLIEKVHYYLEHDEEREKVAQAGYERVIREHTYRHRFDVIFSRVLDGAGR